MFLAATAATACDSVVVEPIEEAGGDGAPGDPEKESRNEEARCTQKREHGERTQIDREQPQAAPHTVGAHCCHS
jgi:hypothetical protein